MSSVKVTLLSVIVVVCALAAVASAKADTTQRKIIVVGSGPAGTSAARYLLDRGIEVTVLEGRSRVGGRLWTDSSSGVKVDLGASWIHGAGDDHPIKILADSFGTQLVETDEASASRFKSDGSAWDEAAWEALNKEIDEKRDRVERVGAELTTDTTVAKLYEQLYPGWLAKEGVAWEVSSNTEFDFGAPLDQLSAKYAFVDKAYEGPELVFPNGYKEIAEKLLWGKTNKTVNAKLKVLLNKNVTHVTTTGANGIGALVKCADGSSYAADGVIVTVPLGILKKCAIKFSPMLTPACRGAIGRMRMGTVNKVFLVFNTDFWTGKTDNTTFFGLDVKHPTAATRGGYNFFVNAQKVFGAPVLLTFGFGQFAKDMEKRTNAQVQSDVMARLRLMFPSAPNPVKLVMSRWSSDPFTYGSYSFGNFGLRAADYKKCVPPQTKTLILAGEHLSIFRGTVHGAYLTGQAAAKWAAGIIPLSMRN